MLFPLVLFRLGFFTLIRLACGGATFPREGEGFGGDWKSLRDGPPRGGGPHSSPY